MATLDDEYNETLLWKRGERVNAEMSEISCTEYQENDGLGGAISMLTDSDNRRILHRKRELTIKTDKRI